MSNREKSLTWWGHLSEQEKYEFRNSCHFAHGLTWQNLSGRDIEIIWKENFQVLKKIIIDGKLYVLDQNSEVNEGDVYFDEHYNNITIATTHSDHNVYNYKKVIASNDENLTSCFVCVRKIPLFTTKELLEQEEDFYRYKNNTLQPINN